MDTKNKLHYASKEKDMKIFNYKTIQIMMLVIALLVSCKDDASEDLKLSRMFEPAAFKITSGQTAVTITWERALFTIAGEVEYQIELSKDMNFTILEYSKKATDPTLTLQDTDIDIRVDYYARVKAIGTHSATDSNWLVSESFRITGELFILAGAESDAGVNDVIIHWQAGKIIAKIVCTPTTGSPLEVAVTDEENSVGQKDVVGLAAGTTYKAELFAADGVSKGSLTFTTKASYDGASVIDLTGITGKPSILVDTLMDIPSGSVILLKRGEVYTLLAPQNIDRAVTIVSAPQHVAQLATIKFSSNFNLVANSAIDSVVFKDLNLTGDDYNARYVFNISQVGTIGKVRFDNCRGHRFRGFFRLQTGGAGTQVANFSVNNCVIDSLRDYGLVTANNSNLVANVKVTNSTIYNARKVIDHKVAGSNSIVFRNCSFYSLPSSGPAGGGSTYFIDLNSQNCNNPIEITNCIFSKSWDDQGLGNDASGIRVGTTTSVNTTNSFALSDFVSTNATYQIPGLIAYPGSSSGVFKSSATGDFTIKDSSFPGGSSAGDPRWRL